MTRSQQRLTSLPVSNYWLAIGFLALLVVLYMLPWLDNPGVGLTTNAYDLAEWTTLHPHAANQPDPMQTALLLRLPLMFIVWIAATLLLSLRQLQAISWWISLVVVGLLWIAVLPPLEFFTSERGNTNYQQQFILWIVAGGGVFVSLSGLTARWRHLIVFLLALFASVVGVWGLLRARDLMIGFSMPVAVAPAAFLFPLAAIGGWLLLVLNKRASKKDTGSLL